MSLKKGILFLLCMSVSVVVQSQTDEQQEIIRAFENRSITLEAVQEFLNNGGDVDSSNRDGWTLLFLATRLGNIELVRFLLDAGADVNAASTGYYPVMRYRPVSDMMIRDYTSIRSGMTPLMLASSDVLSNTEVSLRGGGEVFFPSVSIDIQADIIRLLLERGANANASDDMGLTALRHAALGSEIEPAKVLLDAGVRIKTNFIDSDRRSDRKNALMDAVGQEGHTRVINFLLERATENEVNAPNFDGITALMFASAGYRADSISALLTAGANVDDVDIHGHTALMFPYFALSTSTSNIYVINYRFVYVLDTLRTLLVNGADPNRQDHWGCTAFAYMKVIIG